MAKIAEDKVDEIRSAVNIVHYIAQFINLKKAGQNYKGLCPFHTEKTPSFNVSPQKQIFHCFGCGKGGNIFTFIMDFEKLSFFEAIKKAADFAGIILPVIETSVEQSSYFQKLHDVNEAACAFFENNLYKSGNKQWLEYITRRSISSDTIRLFRLGYAPDSFNSLQRHLSKSNIDLKEAANLGLIQAREKGDGYYDRFRHRIIFPFHSIRGNIIGFGGRRLNEEQQPKYLNSSESAIYKKGEILYGLHQAITAIREKDYVVLVEGYFDLLRLVESGLRNVVASSGTAFTEDQTKLLRRYTKNIYVAYDGDQAGVTAAMRSAMLIEQQELNAFVVPLPETDDPDTFVLQNGLPAFEALIRQKILPIEFRLNAFLKADQHPSIEQKELFIQDILDNLTGIKNQIKIGLYLHQLADRLQINEGMLIGQFNRVKRQKLKTSPTAPQEDHRGRPITPRALPIHMVTFKAESGLIAMLLTANQETRSYIISNISHELFENPELVRLFEYIMNEIEESGAVDAGKALLTFNEDETMKALISELALTEQTEPLKHARGCIYQLKKHQLEKQSIEISRMIKEETASAESIAHYFQEQMNIRKKINELEHQYRKSS